MHRHKVTWVLGFLLTGCTVGPDYQRPDLETPAAWRVSVEDAADLANAAWWERFEDPVLDDMVRTALAENKDLRIASLRVDEFEARLQLERSAYSPQLGYSGTVAREQFSEHRAVSLPAGTDRTNSEYQGSLHLGWELDLWGRIRRSNEAARADLVATAEGRRGVILTLVTGVATSYVQLLGLDRELEISRETLKTREESLRLFERKYTGGAISALELAQARSVYEEAAAAIPALERRIAVHENALRVLLGKNPGPVVRTGSLATLALPPVPLGIPSDILTRRPDVGRAEQELIAANARIGVAKSMYFPSLSLTGLLGYASTQLDDLLEDASGFGSLAATAVGPIFTGGRISAEVKGREFVQQQLVVNYARTVQGAFREVEDALVSKKKLDEQLTVEGRKVQAVQEYAALARKRYDGGYSSYLEVLDGERRLYEAQIVQTQTRRDQYMSLIEIYRAMGGGWPVGGGEGGVPQGGSVQALNGVPGAANGAISD
jgi:multidrug efflux system outer membrane protein